MEIVNILIGKRELFIKAIIVQTDPPLEDPCALPEGFVVNGAVCLVADYRSRRATAAQLPLTPDEYQQWLKLTRMIAKRLKGK
jgi:hypothetical protein